VKRKNAASTRLIAADGLRLPFQDGAFDVLTVGFGLRNMASWPLALQEMSRVLRPGGSLFVLDFSIPRLPGIRQLYLFYLKNRSCPASPAGSPASVRPMNTSAAPSNAFPPARRWKPSFVPTASKPLTGTPLTFGIASLYEARKAG
jgi:demethylmenaquinone methyltransferase/2-methoxy-6-polyprenyl-1,4-benzoquinol methylase